MGAPRKLTGEQEALLKSLRTANAHRKTVRAEARAEAERMIAERMHAAAEAESLLARQCIAAGIPKLRIRNEGLDTSDSHTLEKVLSVTADLANAQDAVIAAHRNERVRLATPDEAARFADPHEPGLLFRIDWDGFPLTHERAREQLKRGTADVHGFVRELTRGRFKYTEVEGTIDAMDAGSVARWEPAMQEALQRVGNEVSA